MMFSIEYYQDPNVATHSWRGSGSTGDARHYFQARDNQRLKDSLKRISIQVETLKQMVSDIQQCPTIESAVSLLTVEIGMGEAFMKEHWDVIDKREDPKTLPNDEIHYRRSA